MSFTKDLEAFLQQMTRLSRPQWKVKEAGGSDPLDPDVRIG